MQISEMSTSTVVKQLGDWLGAQCNVNISSQKYFVKSTYFEYSNNFKARE